MKTILFVLLSVCVSLPALASLGSYEPRQSTYEQPSEEDVQIAAGPRNFGSFAANDAGSKACMKTCKSAGLRVHSMPEWVTAPCGHDYAVCIRYRNINCYCH